MVFFVHNCELCTDVCVSAMLFYFTLLHFILSDDSKGKETSSQLQFHSIIRCLSRILWHLTNISNRFNTHERSYTHSHFDVASVRNHWNQHSLKNMCKHTRNNTQFFLFVTATVVIIKNSIRPKIDRCDCDSVCLCLYDPRGIQTSKLILIQVITIDLFSPDFCWWFASYNCKRISCSLSVFRWAAWNPQIPSNILFS